MPSLDTLPPLDRSGGRHVRGGRQSAAMTEPRRPKPSRSARCAYAVSPASPVYSPTMEWLLTGPAPPMLGEDEDFTAALAPPPPLMYCPVHGFGPCSARDGTTPLLPSPTPPVPAAEVAPPAADLAPTADDDAGEVLDDVHPEARRLLRKFAAAGPAAGGWDPKALDLSSSNEGGPPFL
ncbi:atherin-like [Brachypodium distachyon]|uniref:atherin-like n=1 Tax=Brachypodium distachyon TaxID=15368 RepID=UPI00053009D3|nr:atherin-like [Brachypodium distachyon]|eukprot:XP_010236633.1 atherin-like [Brachypodium distachyon]